jgi:hypothetical protein
MDATRDASRVSKLAPSRELSAIPGEADGGTRTPDPIITSDVLYQLSYVGAVRLDGSDRSGA